MSLAAAARSPMSQHISYLDTVPSHPTSDPAASRQQHHSNNIETSATSRRTTYMLVNPGLIVYPMYMCASVTDRDRIATSWLRLGSHSLRVETSRWSRTPRKSLVYMQQRTRWDARLAPLPSHPSPATRVSKPNLPIHRRTHDWWPDCCHYFLLESARNICLKQPLYSIAGPFHFLVSLIYVNHQCSCPC